MRRPPARDPYRAAIDQIRLVAKRTADFAKFWLFIGPLVFAIGVLVILSGPRTATQQPLTGETIVQWSVWGAFGVLAVTSWFQRGAAIRLERISASRPPAQVADGLNRMMLNGLPAALVGLAFLALVGLQAYNHLGSVLYNPFAWLYIFGVGILPNYLIVRAWLLLLRFRAVVSDSPLPEPRSEPVAPWPEE